MSPLELTKRGEWPRREALRYQKEDVRVKKIIWAQFEGMIWGKIRRLISEYRSRVLLKKAGWRGETGYSLQFLLCMS